MYGHTGFVSIDCGANATYIDSNGLYWTSDDTIVYAGNKSFVTPPTNTDAPVQFSTIRYFPGNQSKYCYVLNNKDHGVEQNSTYLVRASFWAGQGLPYETRVPNTVSFKLLLYADEWDDVFITLPQTSVAMFKEIYVVAIKSSIDVCVAGKDTGMDIPFISSLVLRPLSPTTDYWGAMNDNGGSKLLSYMYRINYGAPSADTIISVEGNPFLCEGNNNEEYCKDLFGSNNSATNGEPLKKKKDNVALIAGIATTGVIAALVAMGLLTSCIVKQNKKTSDAIRHPSNKQANTHQQIDQQESVLAHAKRLQRSNQAHEFTFQAIKTMTRNFETMLGQGGFGPVYYGVLENGLKVAVKVLANNSRQGEHEFLNEVEFLSRVHHKTLVNLVGYCTEGQLVLVYEFMANGTLREALDGRRTQFFSWKDRLQVAVNAAEGLDYLHRGCNPSVIHRDVKSSNILLNEQFEGKNSDFGISKAKKFIDTMDEGSQTFTTVQGSFGYLDPAYAETNIANHSIDVYAFGVVLFEVITGKPPLTKQLRSGQEPQHILQWARPQIERGDISQLVDPRLYQDFDVSSMWKVIDVAMMCVERDRKRRPTMNEIVVELKTALSMEHQIFINDTNILDQQAAFTYITDVHVR